VLSSAAIAIAALIATWSQNAAYFDNTRRIPGRFPERLQGDARIAVRSPVDILLFFLAGAVFMGIEARKHRIKFVWAYILGGAFIAISVTFPLFLIARQMRIGNTDPTRVRAIDMVLVAVFAIAVLGPRRLGSTWLDRRAKTWCSRLANRPARTQRGSPSPMPVTVVATMKAKPESVDAVRYACKQAIEAVHSEPGCDLYSLHEGRRNLRFRRTVGRR